MMRAESLPNTPAPGAQAANPPSGKSAALASAAGGAAKLGGFEALLSALFPAGGPPGQVKAAGAPADGVGIPGTAADAATSATDTPSKLDAAGLLAGGAKAEAAEDDADPAVERTDTLLDANVSPPGPDAGATALAAAIAGLTGGKPADAPKTSDLPDAAGAARSHGKADALPFAAADASATAASDDAVDPKDGHAEPPAWGRDKAPGAPAAPALAHASPAARLAEKAASRADLPAFASPSTTETALPPSPAPAQDPAIPQAVASPNLPETAAPAANAALAENGLAPTPPADGAAKAAKPKGDRAKSGDKPDGASDAAAKASATPNAASSAKAAAANAPASPTDGDASAKPVEAAEPEASASPDSTDPLQPGETRSTTAQHVAAHPASHGVRGSPETVATLAAQILKKLEGRSTRFDLELNPAGLGRVDVRVEIGAQGQLSAALMFDNPQAAADLKTRSAELRQALEQAGFNLAGGLSFDVAQDRGQNGRPHQEQAQDGGRAFRGAAFRSALDIAGDAADSAVRGALNLRRDVNAGLDVRI